MANEKHRLVNDTLTREEDGIVAQCVCGWKSTHWSSMTASAAFMEHQEAEDTQMRKFCEEDTAEWQSKLNHEVRCYQALLEDRDTLSARAETARADALLEAADMCARFDDCGPAFIAQRLRDTATRLTTPAVEKE